MHMVVKLKEKTNESFKDILRATQLLQLDGNTFKFMNVKK